MLGAAITEELIYAEVFRSDWLDPMYAWILIGMGVLEFASASVLALFLKEKAVASLAGVGAFVTFGLGAAIYLLHGQEVAMARDVYTSLKDPTCYISMGTETPPTCLVVREWRVRCKPGDVGVPVPHAVELNADQTTRLLALLKDDAPSRKP